MTFKTKLLALLLQMHQIISTLSELEHSNIPFDNAEVEVSLPTDFYKAECALHCSKAAFSFYCLDLAL